MTMPYTIVTTARIQELSNLGYFVEDMSKEYGSEFDGQFRWLNKISGEFQDAYTSDSEAHAWSEADFFERMESHLSA